MTTGYLGVSIKLLSGLLPQAPTPVPDVAPEPTQVPPVDPLKVVLAIDQMDPVSLAYVIRPWCIATGMFTLQDLMKACAIDANMFHRLAKLLSRSLNLLSFKSRRTERNGVRAVRWTFRKPESGQTPLEKIEQEGPPQLHSFTRWLDRRRTAFTLDDAIVAVYETDDVFDRQRQTMEAKILMAGCRKVRNLDTDEITYYPPPKRRK